MKALSDLEPVRNDIFKNICLYISRCHVVQLSRDHDLCMQRGIFLTDFVLL